MNNDIPATVSPGTRSTRAPSTSSNCSAPSPPTRLGARQRLGRRRLGRLQARLRLSSESCPSPLKRCPVAAATLSVSPILPGGNASAAAALSHGAQQHREENASESVSAPCQGLCMSRMSRVTVTVCPARAGRGGSGGGGGGSVGLSCQWPELN
jgi:hypothetical protein